MTSGKLLIVDDLPDWRRTLAGLFVDEGYEVKVAGSVEAALRALAVEYFNVAILDVRLDESNEGNRDGLSLMRQIKSESPSTEVIVLTGYAEVGMAQEALNTDANGVRFAYSFIQKDQTDELIRQVKQAYEKSIHYLISQGEQENIEFKSSLRWDYEKKSVNKDLQFMIAKSLAGMMNYQGGTLLVGVADDGTILGIDKDLMGLRKSDTDGFRLLLTDTIRNYLGLEFSEYIHARFEGVQSKTICVISIIPSNKPVFVSSGSKHEFWVRTGNSTRQLDVREATDYIQNHWDKK